MSDRLVITHLGHRADGVAVTADGDVFIPYTLPGETVEAELRSGPSRPAQSSARGKCLSPDRIVPFCPHFGICGGCATQHWADPGPTGRGSAISSSRRWRQAHIDAPVADSDRRAWRRPAARGVACPSRNEGHSGSRILCVARAYHYCDRCLPGAGAVHGRNDPGVAWAIAEALSLPEKSRSTFK